VQSLSLAALSGTSAPAIASRHTSGDREDRREVIALFPIPPAPTPGPSPANLASLSLSIYKKLSVEEE